MPRQPQAVGGVEVSLEDREGDAPIGREALELAGQVGIPLQSDHVVAVSGQVQRDAPCSRPELEHRASCGLGQLDPEREVGAVAAELDLLPDGGSCHCQKSAARPRLASRVRSSSSAV